MTLHDDETGFEITLGYDEDGYPAVSISTGGGFYAENHRPTVVVQLNGVVVHEMFTEEDDNRWDPEEKEESNAL